MNTLKKSRKLILSEKQKGSKPGDRQSNQEGGRGGSGKSPSGNPSNKPKPNNVQKSPRKNQ